MTTDRHRCRDGAIRGPHYVLDNTGQSEVALCESQVRAIGLPLLREFALRAQRRIGPEANLYR